MPHQKIVQSCHAVIEATKAFNVESLPDHPSVIILSAKNESRLRRVRKYLIKEGIQHVHFCEPDLDNELTSLATEPIFGDRREVLSKYQLLNNTPDSKRTRYAAKYPDGYYYWAGECVHPPYPTHRTYCIQQASLFSCPDEAKSYHRDAKIVPVEVCYHVEKGGAL